MGVDGSTGSGSQRAGQSAPHFEAEDECPDWGGNRGFGLGGGDIVWEPGVGTGVQGDTPPTPAARDLRGMIV